MQMYVHFRGIGIKHAPVWKNSCKACSWRTAQVVPAKATTEDRREMRYSLRINRNNRLSVPTKALRLTLASVITGILGVTPVFADGYTQSGQQPDPRGTIYGPDSRQFGGPDYSHLRPYGPGYSQGMPQPYSGQQIPHSGVFGRDSRQFGGSDYGLLRPGNRGNGKVLQPNVTASPQTGIYGRGSRSYGGSDYSLLRPNYQGPMPMPMNPMGMRMGPQGPMGSMGPMGPANRTIYGPNSRNFGGPDYGLLQPGQGSQGPGPQVNPKASPETSIYGKDSVGYGNSDYSQLKPPTSSSGTAGSDQGSDAKASPDTTIYGKDSGSYGTANHELIRPDQSK